MTLTDIVEIARGLWVVWLVGVFVAIAVWAFWPGNKARFQAAALIPLRDGDEER
jgi:cytochrome c oxidase cbb3-type subunit 4